MNKQQKLEILDKVIIGFNLQGRFAMNSLGECVYRGDGEDIPNNIKCAIGMLITDEAYDKKIEGCIIMRNPTTSRAALLDQCLEKSGYDISSKDFYIQLQTLHDDLSSESDPNKFQCFMESLNQLKIEVENEQ